MEEPEGTHRTRSKAAPDWTADESLTLVNEITAVESEWGPTLPSFQKWQQIVENCNALGVARSLDQCRRHWDALLADHRRVGRHAPPDELFAAIERCVSGRGGEEEEAVMETDPDPDSDPEAQGRVTNFFVTGSKKQRRRMKRKKRKLATINPWGYYTSTNVKHEESSSINEKVGTTKNRVENAPKESNSETKEQKMATMLYENALQINAILEANLTDDVDYNLDLKSTEAVQTDFTRRQGDKLIDCLGKFSVTLNQLCGLVQQCK